MKIEFKEVNSSVWKYIRERLSEVTISDGDLTNIPVLTMMYNGDLNGWSWQSTFATSVFFENDDEIARGYLDAQKVRKYPHSWIEFKYLRKYYCFDPALNILCDMKEYYQKLDAELKEYVSVREAKEKLITLVNSRSDEKIYIPGTNNMEDPFFRLSSDIIVKLDDNKIKKLSARFYSDG